MRRASSSLCPPPTILLTLLLIATIAVRSQAQTAPVEPQPACAAIAVEIPAAIHASDQLRRCIERMLKRSETFRAQCRRIAGAPQLHIDAQVDAGIVNTSQRARTRILRVQTGAIYAWVSVAALGDPTEWVAHEFEHLIEQLDGVRLRDLAERRSGVWLTGADMFESDRAIRIGRQVADEVRTSPRVARTRLWSEGAATFEPIDASVDGSGCLARR